jgi:hypothetical protein
LIQEEVRSPLKNWQFITVLKSYFFPLVEWKRLGLHSVEDIPPVSWYERVENLPDLLGAGLAFYVNEMEGQL